MSRAHLFLLASALAIHGSLSSQGSLWLVDGDGGPGVDFLAIQGAIDAASEGDAVLVRAAASSYDAFSIDGKSLTVLADPADAPVVALSFFVPTEVKNLTASQRVTLIGFRLSLEVSNNAGSVWLEELLLEPTGVFDLGSDALHVAASNAVVVSRCFAKGESSDSPGALAGAGIRVAADSSVAAYESTFEGGRGLGGCFAGGSHGGHGAVIAGTLFASDCVFAGGNGGDFDDCLPGFTNFPTDGGDGARLEGASAQLETLASSLIAGLAGEPGEFPEADDGVPLAEGSGTWIELAGGPGAFASAGPVVEGANLELSITGPAGDFVFGIASPLAGLLPLPGFSGPLTTGVPFNLHSIGFLPASGTTELMIGTEDLGAGIEFLVRYVQPLVVSPSLEFVLGAPTTLVVLDDGAP